jgi:hypothetical protein
MTEVPFLRLARSDVVGVIGGEYTDSAVKVRQPGPELRQLLFRVVDLFRDRSEAI